MKSISVLVLLGLVAVVVCQTEIEANEEEVERCIEVGIEEGLDFEEATREYNKCTVTCTYTGDSTLEVPATEDSQCCPNPSPISAPTGCCNGVSTSCDVGKTQCFSK